MRQSKKPTRYRQWLRVIWKANRNPLGSVKYPHPCLKAFNYTPPPGCCYGKSEQ